MLGGNESGAPKIKVEPGDEPTDIPNENSKAVAAALVLYVSLKSCTIGYPKSQALGSSSHGLTERIVLVKELESEDVRSGYVRYASSYA
ncbi:hypothetical protein SDJN03_11206, partial [Cucurbita argyrosperma subsp. sororia]